MECSAPDEGHLPGSNRPGERFLVTGDLTGNHFRPVSELLARPAVPLITVVPLANQVFSDTKEITHGDFAAFKISDLKESKKHLLGDVISLFAAGEATKKDDHPLVMEVKELANPPGTLLGDNGRLEMVRYRIPAQSNQTKPGGLRIRS